jgi:hypothetical protein
MQMIVTVNLRQYHEVLRRVRITQHISVVYRDFFYFVGVPLGVLALGTAEYKGIGSWFI